jgi:two-component system response regulator RegA
MARLEWEHIQQVLADCGGDLPRAARLLGVHRRMLQRTLAARPAPDRQ